MNKKLINWLIAGLGIVLIVVGIVLMNKVDWLKIFGMDIGIIVLCGGVVALTYAYVKFIPSREAKVYLDSNGMPDISSERSYTAKKLKFGQGFFSRGKIAIPNNSLQTFYVKNGRVEMTVKTGKLFSSDLSDLMVKYSLEENGVSGEMEISGYSFKNNKTGEKMTIYYPGMAFEDEEWKDMAGVFS